MSEDPNVLESPEPGQRVYNADGYAAEFLAKCEGGYIVFPLMQGGLDEDDCFRSDRPEVWANVYAQAPTPVRSKQVADLMERAQQLHGVVTELMQEKTRIERERAALLSRLKETRALARIDDFLAGRITHYAVIGSHYTTRYEVLSREEAISKDSGWSKAQRLLCLYGKSNGDLEWRLSEYAEPSGVNLIVHPCLSEAEAREIVVRTLRNDMDAWAKSGATQPYVAAQYVKFAETFGVEVPAELRAIHDVGMQRLLTEAVTKAAATLQAAERELAAFQATVKVATP